MYSCKSLDTGDLLLSLPLVLASTASQCGMARQEGTARSVFTAPMYTCRGDWPSTQPHRALVTQWVARQIPRTQGL